MVINPKEENAKNRAKLLWEHYDKHGKLSLKEFEKITKGQYYSVSQSFIHYDIIVPPVWNSSEQKAKNKAKLLNDKVKELGKESLTMKEAAKVLGIKKGQVVSAERRILRYGFKIPDIVDTERKIENNTHIESRDYTEFAGKINGHINPTWHPKGLPVLYWYVNKKTDDTHYMIR